MRWASGHGVSPSRVRLCAVRPGWARLGKVRSGRAWAAMAARRAYGPSLPPSLADVARFGPARLGRAGRGQVRHGLAWQGLQTAARSLFGGSLLLSLEGRSGKAGSVQAW